MENRANEATSQRPEGARLLDAPLVSMDLNHFVKQLRGEPTWKDSDRNSVTIYKSQGLVIVLIGLHKEAKLKTHTANGVISVQVLEGHIRFTTEQREEELTKGQMVALWKKIPHEVVALEETFFLLTMASV